MPILERTLIFFQTCLSSSLHSLLQMITVHNVHSNSIQSWVYT